MTRFLISVSALAIFAGPALADHHAGTSGYALSADGVSLTMMSSLAAPGEAQTVELSTPVRSIAWRQ